MREAEIMELPSSSQPLANCVPTRRPSSLLAGRGSSHSTPLKGAASGRLTSRGANPGECVVPDEAARKAPRPGFRVLARPAGSLDAIRTSHPAGRASARGSVPHEMGAARVDFGMLASRYRRMLYRIAFRMLRNREDAEDAVQDALLLAFQHLGQFEGRAQISTWMGRIVLNAARMRLRRRSAHEMQSLDKGAAEEGEPRAALIVWPGRSPFELFRREELHANLSRLLERLPEDLRAAVQLRVVHGISLSQAAERLHLKDGTLKCHVHRATAQLRVMARRQQSAGMRRRLRGNFRARPAMERNGPEKASERQWQGKRQPCC